MEERDPKEIIRRIRKIQIVTTRLVNEQLAGEYHSVFKGQGMDFDEVRPYQPGDDVRSIDWNVSARTGEPFIKTFREERELTVMLLVDLSGDMQFTTRCDELDPRRPQLKGDVGALVAAMLAFSAIENNDRVGLILFTDVVEHFVPPKKGTSHVLRVVRDILTYRPKSSGKRLEAGLEFLGRVTRRKAVAFLLSDFYASGWEAALRVARRRHDITPVLVSDPREKELLNLGLCCFQDPKTDELHWRSTGPRFLQRYQRLTAKRHAEVTSLFRRMKLNHAELTTGTDPAGTLVEFFRRRARRRR